MARHKRIAVMGCYLENLRRSRWRVGYKLYADAAMLKTKLVSQYFLQRKRVINRRRQAENCCLFDGYYTRQGLARRGGS